MPTLFVARHAPTSLKGICYGHHDVPIEMASDTAAARLRSTLPSTSSPARFWTSPSLRCSDVATQLAMPATVDPRLREMNFGAWEDRDWNTIEREPEFAVWARDWRRVRVPGGESAEDLDARVASWLSELDDEYAHFAIAHAGVIRSLRVLVAGVTWEDAMRVPVPHVEWISIGDDASAR